MKAARLRENGIATFASWLETLKVGGSLTAPLTLLTDPQTSESLAADVEIEQRDFTSRYEAAEYLHQRFSESGLTEVGGDRGLWAWLSLFYFDAVCPLGKDGRRKPGELARYVPELENFQRYYRHLLAGPYLIYRAHRDSPKRALCLLCQEVHKPGDLVGQIAARQAWVTNRAVIELATKLYVDPVTGKKKRGAEGKGGGSPRRLSDVLEQFDLTWDLYAATADELASVMPSEFEKFLKT